MTPTPSSMKMLFLIIWNIAGLLVRPKNMTRGWNRPQLHCCIPLDIQFGEVLLLGFGHHVEDVGDQGQGVGILYGELLVILDKAEASFLLDEEDWGGNR